MPVVNDGSYAYGSLVVAINSSSIVLEQITDTETGTVIDIRDQLNAPAGRITIPNFNNLTATGQRLTAATVPSVGNTFTFNGATWVLTEVGKAYTQADIQKFALSAYRKIN